MENDTSGVPHVTVLVPAAGEGRRLGGAPKQFRTLGDAPLLVQTLRAFDRHPAITQLVVVAPADRIVLLRQDLAAFGLRKLSDVVAGGATRQESVRLGLASVSESCEVILVHDGVRPFVSKREITEVVEAARRYGASSVAISVVDTLRQAGDGRFGSTVPREGLFRMQTPQGFSRTVIVDAHAAAAAQDGAEATDDVEVAQMAGHDVYVVQGSSENFKITTPEDWHRAERIWDSWIAENRS
ncbi:MAG: 2-C-methyl-D-erythritol 4-phosphate cytidylyltransferase [Rhodothermales bacterium]|nr:2-C-methyl-D-erythritol 4-phosphate cytidylyltransferase [Rhodothermales bacterium]